MPETPYIMIDATRPRTAIYKGRPLNLMTREELIDVIIEMTHQHIAELNAAYYRARDILEKKGGKSNS